MTTQKVVEIISLPVIGDKIGCSSPKCDGRPARWVFPQSPEHLRHKFTNGKDIVRARITSCNVHLAALAQIVETWHVEPTPVPGTGCDG